MDPEISSFTLEFQNLCRAGKNANLSFTSSNGKVIVNLNVQLGSLPSTPQVHSPPYRPHLHRYGPSRERRRLKRAEARKIAAEEAANELSTEEVEILKLAEKAENEAAKIAANTSVETTKETENVYKEPTDEICSDSEYQAEHPVEEVDTAELARDKIVEKVIIYPVTKPIEKKSEVEEEVKEKFAAIGVRVKHMETRTTYKGEFKGSIVDISPVNLNIIWGRRLHLKNCSIISFEE
jgi:hypothetical protein